MSNLSLRARDNIFTLDANLIIKYSHSWNELKQNKDIAKNLKHFKRIIDFDSCKIDRMYYVGSDSTVEVLKSILSDNSLHESPTKINNDSLNDFERIIRANYSQCHDSPTTAKKDAVKLMTYEQMEKIDKTKKPIRPFEWSVSFLDNNCDRNILEDKKNCYFNDFRQTCNNRCVPIFDTDKLENEFSKFDLFPSSLRPNERVYPKDFFKPMSSPSNFFIVFDKYLFSWRTKKLNNDPYIETLFGYIKKEEVSRTYKLSRKQKIKNKYIERLIEEDNYYKCDSKYMKDDKLIGQDSYISKEAFNDINMRLSFYLRGIDSFDKKPNHIFLIGSATGGNGSTEFKYYIKTLEKRIVEIIRSREIEEQHELECLELILSFKDSIKMVRYGVYGPKTKCGKHNRLIFNDHSLLEWGGGHAAFRKKGFTSKYWLSTSDQSIASYSIFKEVYKLHLTEDQVKKLKDNHGYENDFERLSDFCDDFQNTMIPKASV